MKFAKRLFDFYINSSIHVALAVVSLVFVTLYEFELPVDLKLIGFLFFGTITGYNFVKYAGIAGLHHRSLAGSLRVIQSFSAICFALWLFIILEMHYTFWLACIPLGLLTLLYAVPFLPRHKNLRAVPSIKIFIIAAVWSGATVYLPLAYFNFNWDVAAGIELLQRFLLTLILILPFEIRDLEFDSKNLVTLPQIFGIKKTQIVGYSFVVLYVVLQYFQETHVHWPSALILMSLCVVAIFFSRKRQKKYYASFWVEGIPIAWWLLTLLLD